MSNIALRSYHQKIEVWIEENKIDKAISQSLLILQQFPRNLLTYQILSRALLQKQDFLSADKVFDIILQIEPDDFVSHIGKSMIAENNHFLESAIEHMKLAFEIQPTNEGIKKELKRLFFAKDGFEPNKIHLTRGALIKMYLKGKLYQQTIAEARIGLSESPQRIDYRIAMGKAFFESDDLIQAIETSIEIISKLPFCWAANEILDKVLSRNKNTENYRFFHNRLVELDPYYAYILPSTNSVFDVPDIAVMLEDLTEREGYKYDLIPAITTTWDNQEQLSEKINTPVEDLDWDSIITRAAESRLVTEDLADGEPIQIGDELKNYLEADKMTDTRKKLFLERIRSSKTSSYETRADSDWFFDENGKIQQNEKKSVSVDSNPLTNQINGDSPGSEFSEPTSSENGVFDTDIPPAIRSDAEIEDSKALWLNEQEGFSRDSKTIFGANLDDTQQIIISYENSNDLILDAEKALEGGNVKFAFTIFRQLITHKQNLSEVSLQLENAVELYPEETDFRILLGEAYLLLDKKEKALGIFQNTQKLITL
jgi:tetratricopeptide (TPR) repeat protein